LKSWSHRAVTKRAPASTPEPFTIRRHAHLRHAFRSESVGRLEEKHGRACRAQHFLSHYAGYRASKPHFLCQTIRILSAHS
jgi:hypothetical protein